VDETIPSHQQSYWEELAKPPEVKIPEGDIKDFQYLVGIQYVDPDYGHKFETTRVVVQHGLIVTYRAPVKANGIRTDIEERDPMHVKDVVQMVHVGQQQSSIGTHTATQDIPVTAIQAVAKPKRRKRLITSRPIRTTHLSNSTRKRPSTTRSKYVSLHKPTVSRLRRIRHQRILLNAAQLGNVGYNVTDLDTVLGGPNTVPVNDTVADALRYTERPSNTTTSLMQYAHLIQHEEMVPKTYQKAMESEHAPQWQEAVTKEIKSLVRLGTWRIVDRPRKYVRYQTGAFIFKKKYTGLNNITIYKARLIAHGYRQQYGRDYWETYAPVSSSRAIRILLALAASRGMTIHQMDVETAFLNALLEEDIYMLPPAGVDLPDGKVLLLQKSLYGLKQSPRNFNKDLNKTILNMGFTRCISDSCIYLKNINGKDIYMAVYVDDIIIACTDLDIINEIKELLKKKYTMKDMGEMDWYLGMRYTRNTTTGIITLDQTKYAEDVLTKYQNYYSKNPYHTTPMEENLKLLPWSEASEAKLTEKCKMRIKNYPYRQVVGSLLYLAIWTRPDITYAVHLVAKHCVHPTLQAVDACGRILSYLSQTKQLGLEFHPGNMKLTTYVDSSYADVVEDRKSTGGMIQYLGYSPIYWETFVANTTTSLSTAEAEYVAAHVGGKEIMSSNNLLTEMKYPQHNVPLFEDNQACIAIALQESCKHKTKHIDNKIHYIRDLIQRKIVDMIYISTKIQLADIFTKALGKATFLKHRDVILGRPPSNELAVYLKSVAEMERNSRTDADIDTKVHCHPMYPIVPKEEKKKY